MRRDPGSPRLRVVLDTNIYIAAFDYPKGRNALVWNAGREGRYQLIVSPAILREMAEVLGSDFAWDNDRVRKAVRLLASAVCGCPIVPSLPSLTGFDL